VDQGRLTVLCIPIVYVVPVNGVRDSDEDADQDIDEDDPDLRGMLISVDLPAQH
jgi:hypothetical protein